MTRDEFAWLIVRGIGAIFLMFVVLDLIYISLTSVNAYMTRYAPMGESVDQDVEIAIQYGRLIGRIWSTGVEVVLKAFLSYYCFFRGGWLHKLITDKVPSVEQS